MISLRRVIGHSMEPEYSEGSVVLCIKGKARVGDVVVARARGKEVIKRITDESEKGFYLSGKDRVHSTGWVKRSDIKGKVIKLWPR